MRQSSKITIAAIIGAASVFSVATSTLAQNSGDTAQIGVILSGTPKTHGWILTTLRKGLKDRGHMEKKTFVLEPRYGMGKRGNAPKLAAELVNAKVDLIVVSGTTNARAALKATQKIPVVVATAGDLARSGVLKKGANVTGMSAASSHANPERLRLLKDALPTLSSVAIIYSGRGSSKLQFEELKSAGKALGLKVVGYKLRKLDQMEPTVKKISSARTGAMVVLVSRMISSHRKKIAAIANELKIPTLCWAASAARAGCLMSYGANRKAMVHSAAGMVDKILKGTKITSIPMQTASKFDFVVNLKTAKLLNVKVPKSVLARASQVVK